MEPSSTEQNQVFDESRYLASIDYKDPILWKKLIRSDDPKDKQLLNSIVMKIIEERNNTLFALLLANGYTIDVLNAKGQTALHYAFNKYSHLIVRTILTWEPFKNNSLDLADNNGLTYLHIACTEYKVDVLEIIKRYLRNGSDINACYHSDPKNKHSHFTPLHFAVTNHKVDVVKYLVENAADVNEISKGRTPLHIASQISVKNVSEIVDLLVTFHSNIEARDQRGNTPLLSIFDNDECMEINFSINESKIKFDVLLKNGADIRATNNKGDNALHLIIKTLRFSHYHVYIPHVSFNDTEHAEFVKEILKKNGEFLEAKNNEGKTPLQLAVSMASADVVKVLLDHGAGISYIKIDCGDEKIFCYPEIVPTFDVVHNITTIMRLISDRGFVPSLEDHFMTLKFLIHEVDSCECTSNDCAVNIVWKTMNAIEYGFPTHAIYILNKLRENNTIDAVLYFLHDYKNLMKDANFYLEKQIERIIIEIILAYENDYSDSNKELREKELAHLKSDVELENGVKLYDLMLKHPNAVSRLFRDNDFDAKVMNNFVKYKSIIEGFLTKVIVRNYIVRSAYDFLPLTPLSPLPALCNEIILRFLSNVDIFNLCSTALLPENIKIQCSQSRV